MEPPSSSRISVINESETRVAVRAVVHAAQCTLNLHGIVGELAILLADNDRIRELNRQWRNLDEATDVLTFPAPAAAAGFLGDVAISVPFAKEQAAARGVTLDTEVAYLAIHGVLHIAGFDDISDADRNTMFAEMERCATYAGLPAISGWHSMPHEAVR